METVGDYISLIFLLVFGLWIGSIIHTYYMRQILTEIKKMNQSGPTPIVDIPKKVISSLMYCSDCDTGYRADRTACPECGGTNRYLKNG
jgi:primosomal protein N'